MGPDIENRVDWSVASTPESERVTSGLSPKKTPARTLPTTKRGVMETLLGENELAAHDESGRDPYNTTGRQFRR